MERLGPFEPRPRVAVAVSGGPDSVALAVLARDWTAARGGAAVALIVDHRLRPESGAEAKTTRDRLATRSIPATILPIAGLEPGPALAARARGARYAALEAACRQQGIAHLLLGHHAADQAETVLLRALSGSGSHGLAGMAALVERPSVRLLRPVLDVPPRRLRAFLIKTGAEWVEDPSNTDRRATRPRIRSLRLDRDGAGSATFALSASAGADGRRRSHEETVLIAAIASQVTIRPEGFAVIESGRIPALVLARVIAAIGGSAWPLPRRGVAELANAPRPATIGGVQLTAAGRFGGGWLAVREARAMAAPVPAVAGAVWDRRFRMLQAGGDGLGGLTLGALGQDAARLRDRSDLSFAIMRTLPAVRRGDRLVAVPHLDWPDPQSAARFGCAFAPAHPLGPPAFVPI